MVNNTNKISIIIPVYNAAKYLDQCIKSVVNQSYDNLEIILVNDGSTDESLNICNNWKSIDDRVIIIDKENEGPANSRNKGLEIASGDYIGFVDSDDYIEPQMYELLLNDLLNNNADVVMCNSLTVSKDGHKTVAYKGYSSFEVSGKEVANRLMNFEKIFCSSVWSKLYKRSILKDIRFESKISLGEDYLFNGLIYPRINKFYYDEHPLYNYRIIDDSMSRKQINKHFFDKYKVAQLLKQEYGKLTYIDDKDITHFTFSMSYEILYELYLHKGFRNEKKIWKRIFLREAKLYSGKTLKGKIKIFLMKYFTHLYVNMTNKQ